MNGRSAHSVARNPFKIRTEHPIRMRILSEHRESKDLESRANHYRLWFSENSPSNSFRMRTCKSVSKQRTSTPFGMNTYKKPGGRGGVIVNLASDQDASPEERSDDRPVLALPGTFCAFCTPNESARRAWWKGSLPASDQDLW